MALLRQSSRRELVTVQFTGAACYPAGIRIKGVGFAKPVVEQRVYRKRPSLRSKNREAYLTEGSAKESGVVETPEGQGRRRRTLAY